MPLNITVFPGQPVLLDCTADGNPTPVLSWNYKGQDVTGVPLLQVLANGSLYIAVFRRSMAGLYTCVASNSAGRVQKQARISYAGTPNISAPMTCIDHVALKYSVAIVSFLVLYFVLLVSIIVRCFWLPLNIVWQLLYVLLLVRLKFRRHFFTNVLEVEIFLLEVERISIFEVYVWEFSSHF